MPSHRHKRYVYHLTSLENLPAIRREGLRSRRDLVGSPFVDVADHAILEGRSAFALDALVPFHFLPKNPFDYGVLRARPTETFVLLAVERTYARDHGWCVIPRHPLTGAAPRVLAWEEGIDGIDWSQMDRGDRSYEDHECKMVCMAEALSPTVVPWAAVRCVFVATPEAGAQARAAVGPRANITVLPAMLPKGAR